MKDKKIVPVNENLISAAAVIHSLSWKESHRSFCTPEFTELHSPEHQLEYIKEKIRNGSSFYMLIDSEPVGIVSITGDLIEDLYVLPDRQNRGYGTELLRYAIGLCKGAPSLWILENNDRARRLYLREGFRETGRRNAITEGLDEIEFSMERKVLSKEKGHDTDFPIE